PRSSGDSRSALRRQSTTSGWSSSIRATAASRPAASATGSADCWSAESMAVSKRSMIQLSTASLNPSFEPKWWEMSPMATPASAAMERRGVPAKPLAAKRWRPALRMRARPVRSLPPSCDPSWAAAVAMSSPLPFRNDPVPARAHACSCLLLRAGSAPSFPANSSMPVLAADICPLGASAPCWLGETLLNILSATDTFVQDQRSVAHCGESSSKSGHRRTTNGDRATDQTPLNGITLLTLAVKLPGPRAAARLTQLGAQLIKVEPPIGDRLDGAVAD